MTSLFVDFNISIIHGYTRVSTSHQLEGLSIDNQEQKIQEFAQKNNLNLKSLIKDLAVSGGKTHTERLLGQIVENIQPNECIVVCSLCRLGRNVNNIMFLMEKAKKEKWFIYVLNLNLLYPSNTINEFIIHALSIVSQVERSLTSDRVKSSWEYKKKNNLVKSKRWFEKSTGNELQDFKRSLMIKTIQDEYNLGKSYEAIAQKLNHDGFRTLHNKLFYGQTVNDIVEYLISKGSLKRRNLF